MQIVMGAAPSVAAPIATTKTCAGDTAGSTSVSCTPSTSYAIGESIVCGVNSLTTALTYTVTDSNSDTFTAQGSQTTFNINGTNTYAQNFYFLNLTTSISAVTFNMSGSGSFPSMMCQSATGVAAGGADGQSTGSISSGTTLTSGSITTTAKDWLVCQGTTQGGITLSAGAGFTYSSHPNSNNGTEYLVQSSAGSITPTMTLDNSAFAGIVCSAFK